MLRHSLTYMNTLIHSLQTHKITYSFTLACGQSHTNSLIITPPRAYSCIQSHLWAHSHIHSHIDTLITITGYSHTCVQTLIFSLTCTCSNTQTCSYIHSHERVYIFTCASSHIFTPVHEPKSACTLTHFNTITRIVMFVPTCTLVHTFA